MSRLPSKQSLNLIQSNTNDVVTPKQTAAVTGNYVNFSKPHQPKATTHQQLQAKIVNSTPPRRISIFRPNHWDAADAHVIPNPSAFESQHIDMDAQKTMAIPLKAPAIRQIDEAHIATAQLQSLQNQPRIGAKYRMHQGHVSHTSAIVQKVMPKNILVSTNRLPNKVDVMATVASAATVAGTATAITSLAANKSKVTTIIHPNSKTNIKMATVATALPPSSPKPEPPTITRTMHIISDNTSSTKRNIQQTNRTMSESSRPVDTVTHKLLTPGGVNIFSALPVDMNGMQRGKHQTKSTKQVKPKTTIPANNTIESNNHPMLGHPTR